MVYLRGLIINHPYTMLIYFDTADIDFTGGELEFVDEIIKPHRCLIIKFYD